VTDTKIVGFLGYRIMPHPVPQRLFAFLRHIRERSSHDKRRASWPRLGFLESLGDRDETTYRIRSKDTTGMQVECVFVWSDGYNQGVAVSFHFSYRRLAGNNCTVSGTVSCRVWLINAGRKTEPRHGPADALGITRRCRQARKSADSIYRRR